MLRFGLSLSQHAVLVRLVQIKSLTDIDSDHQVNLVIRACTGEVKINKIVATTVFLIGVVWNS